MPYHRVAITHVLFLSGVRRPARRLTTAVTAGAGRAPGGAPAPLELALAPHRLRRRPRQLLPGGAPAVAGRLAGTRHAGGLAAAALREPARPAAGAPRLPHPAPRCHPLHRPDDPPGDAVLLAALPAGHHGVEQRPGALHPAADRHGGLLHRRPPLLPGGGPLALALPRLPRPVRLPGGAGHPADHAAADHRGEPQAGAGGHAALQPAQPAAPDGRPARPSLGDDADPAAAAGRPGLGGAHLGAARQPLAGQRGPLPCLRYRGPRSPGGAGADPGGAGRKRALCLHGDPRTPRASGGGLSCLVPRGEEVDRIALTIEGGREAGYRAWSHKQNFPGSAEGRWRIDVMTDSGQRIGVLRFRVATDESATLADGRELLTGIKGLRRLVPGAREGE